MKFYCYKGDAELGSEPLGSDNRLIWHDLKTIGSARNRAKKIFKGASFRLYSFTNFQDNKTFKEV